MTTHGPVTVTLDEMPTAVQVTGLGARGTSTLAVLVVGRRRR